MVSPTGREIPVAGRGALSPPQSSGGENGGGTGGGGGWRGAESNGGGPQDGDTTVSAAFDELSMDGGSVRGSVRSSGTRGSPEREPQQPGILYTPPREGLSVGLSNGCHRAGSGARIPVTLLHFLRGLAARVK